MDESPKRAAEKLLAALDPMLSTCDARDYKNRKCVKPLGHWVPEALPDYMRHASEIAQADYLMHFAHNPFGPGVRWMERDLDL